MNQLELVNLKLKLRKMKNIYDEITYDMNKLRDYYKYQNGDTDSCSEDIIVTFSNYMEIDSIIDGIDELIEYENE